LATETGLDGCDGAPTATGVAGHEIETILSLVQVGIGTAAGLAGDVLDCRKSTKLAHNSDQKKKKKKKKN
jgi:hypothetical protein